MTYPESSESIELAHLANDPVVVDDEGVGLLCLAMICATEVVATAVGNAE